ncbi:hypothetical protein K6T82_18855 [Flavobacterium sp. 17A]|uniref:Uncharacterized protein n=1 Tax=Flavobacterium potami TaxID=2872310 RepID=A0A9X1HEF6_9FLAO|nr:hypothetical protein [Flavobacterium potami]MBZ4036837.1 hypothetical protein [Flavobacterium potami]
MKKIFNILIVLMLFFYEKGYSQQLVQNINEIHRLKDYEGLFVNKPLKDLLKEIKPQIKTVIGFNDYPGFFNFRFTTLEQQRLRQGSVQDRVSLYVTIKEQFNWNWEERPKGKEVIWTNEDVVKYGNLTVVKIEVVTKK